MPPKQSVTLFQSYNCNVSKLYPVVKIFTLHILLVYEKMQTLMSGCLYNLFELFVTYFLSFHLALSTLWWSLNLSDNFAFNFWRVNFINSQLLIIKSIAICYCLFWAVSALWLAEAFTATHTPGDTGNHKLFTPYLICMCISERQNMLANQICMYTTRKSCPIVGELASSLMEGTSIL